MKITSLEKTRWENWSNVLMGLWVFLTPWTLASGFQADGGNTSLWNFLLIGGIVVLVSLLAIKKVQIWAEWISLSAGVWLIFSPWFLFYYDNKLLSVHSQICGFVIALLSGLTIPAVENYGKVRFHKHNSDNDEHFLLKH